ncbi:ogr/Delta-like zinc finger family protein [Altericroceibacterium endophyticum]|nr:ogr/Delta-like zinc finger family protein [Altericroceibacterium endophyticum]
MQTKLSVPGRPVYREHSGKSPLVRCPTCGARAKSRTSAEITPTYRELRYSCSDVECGMTWVAGLAFVRELSPSGFGTGFREDKPEPRRMPGHEFGQLPLNDTLERQPSG